MKLPKTEMWLKISRVVLVMTKTAAWLWSFVTMIGIAGDPPANQTLAQNEARGDFLLHVFVCFLTLWFLVIIAALWYRHLRAKWTKENSSVWVAENTKGSGTLQMPLNLSASPFLRENSWEASKEDR